MNKIINIRLFHWIPVIGLILLHFSDFGKKIISTKQDLIYCLLLSVFHGISIATLASMIFF